MIEFSTITLIIVLAAISPGPDFVMVIKNALAVNRRTGILTALGVSSSLLIHSSYSLLGLGIIISESMLLFTIIKYISALYLIYIGIINLRVKKTSISPNDNIQKIDTKSLSLLQAFFEGFLCNLLNPKAILFILAFFTLILKPSTSWFWKVSFAIEITVIHLLWFSLLSIIVTHKPIKNNLYKIQHYIVRLMGGILIVFGAHIALST